MVSSSQSRRSVLRSSATQPSAMPRQAQPSPTPLPSQPPTSPLPSHPPTSPLPSQPYVAPSPTQHSSPVTSSCQPSSAVLPSSQSTGSTQPTKKIKKYLITVKSSGTIVGENQARWKSWSGHFIRSHIPIRYHDWRKVPKPFKDDVWNALMGEFQLNVHPDIARPLLEKEFPQRFRTAKNIYRDNILEGKTREEALAACPNGMDLGHWELCCQ